MHLELVHESPYARTEFHVLDVYQGTVDTELTDTGSYLVYVAHPEGERNAAWLVESGTTIKLLEHGWDSHPTAAPAISELLSGSVGEVGVVKLHTIRTGVSGHRVAFDGYAPGWSAHLDTLETSMQQLDQALQVSHASIDPLTGLPQVRLAGLPPENFSATHNITRRDVKLFVARCVTSCIRCGAKGASQTASVEERSGGRVHRYVCLEHRQ